MDVTPLIKQGQQIIQSYAGGRFRVNGELYTTSVIVYPDSTTEWSNAKQIADLEEGDFSDLIARAEELDVVLLGCGTTMQFLDPKLKNALKDKDRPVETMDTGAACRTYNVLLAEGRRVAAALLPAA